MINARNYALIDNLKNKEPETYNAVQALLKSQLEEFSSAAHEEKNYISFIGSSYQFISSHNQTLKSLEFWNDIGESLHSLNNFMSRMTLYRRCQKTSCDDICINDLLFDLPDLVDNYNSSDSSIFFSNNYSFNVSSDNIHISGDYAGIQAALVEILVNSCEASNTNDDIIISTYTSCHEPVISTSELSQCNSGKNASSVTICITNHGNILSAINQDETNSAINETNPLEKKQLPYKLSDNEIFSLCKAFYTTKKETHCGLGLSIAYVVCQKNNGILNIVQTDSSTSVFLTFPVTKCCSQGFTFQN